MNSINKIKAFGLTENEWHDDSVVFSPDIRQILSFSGENRSGSRRKDILLWDLPMGKLLRRLDGHKGDVVYVSFLPSGVNAISVSEIGEIFYWDLTNGTYQSIIEMSEGEKTGQFNKIYGASLTLDGRYLYIFYKLNDFQGLNDFKEFDLLNKKVIGSFHIIPEDIRGVVDILPDGSLFICFRSKEVKIRVYDDKKQDQSKKFRIKYFSPKQSKKCNSIKFSKYGRYVAIAQVELDEDGGFESGMVDIWDSYKQDKIQSFRLYNSRLQFSPNGKFFTDDSSIWNINSGEVIIHNIFLSNATCAGFSPDDRYAIFIPSAGVGTAILVDLENGGKPIQSIGGHGDFSTIYCALFNEQSNQVITSEGIGTVSLLWDLNSGYSTHILNKEYRRSTIPIAISQDGGFAVTYSFHEKQSQDQGGFDLQIWDLTTGELISEKQSSSIKCVLTPDQKYLLSSEAIWDVKSWHIVRKFAGHKEYDGPICLSNNGYIVLSGCKDNSISLWSILTGEEIHRFKDTSNTCFLALSFDDKYAISLGGKGVRLWNLESKSLEGLFDKDNEHVTCAAFIPKTQYIISGGEDKKLKIWDAKSGLKILERDQPETIVNLTVSHNGKYLYLATYSEISTWEIKLLINKGGEENFDKEAEYTFTGGGNNSNDEEGNNSDPEVLLGFEEDEGLDEDEYVDEDKKMDITAYRTTKEIFQSGLFTPEERRREYRRRGKSPSGVIDGEYNDNYLEEGEIYNDSDRDWDADA